MQRTASAAFEQPARPDNLDVRCSARYASPGGSDHDDTAVGRRVGAIRFRPCRVQDHPTISAIVNVVAVSISSQGITKARSNLRD